MTTVTRGEVGTQMVQVRARYAADSMSVIEAQDFLYDLGCLMLVGYMLDPGESAEHGGVVKRWPWKRGEQLAAQAANDTHVRSITYNSPLEIVLAVSWIAGSAVVIAERLVHLYQDVQRARALTATTSTHVAAQSIVRRHLEQVLADIPTEQGNRWIVGAARAAESIEHLDLEPGDR